MKYRKLVGYAFSFTIICIAGILLFRGASVILPCLLPFIFAYMTAALAEKPKVFLSEKYNIKRSFCSVLCLSVLLIIITCVIVTLCSWVYFQLTSLAETLPDKLLSYAKALENAENSISALISNAPSDYRQYLMRIFNSLTEKISAIPSYISGKLPGVLSAIAGTTPKLFLFIITYIIAAFSMGTNGKKLKSAIITHIPEKLRPFLSSAKSELKSAFVSFIRSQLLLMMITFFELCICFYLIGISHPPLISGIIALLDALPLLGTGTVLLPWALLSFLGGSRLLSIYLVVIYLITALSRRFLEPHIVSSQLGLDPILSLFSIYGGYKLFGVGGMMLFPLFMLLIKRLYSAYKSLPA